MNKHQAKSMFIAALTAAVFVLLICAVFLITQPASALNISMADSTLPGNHSLLIINGDGALLASGYSTETFDLAIADPDNTTLVIHLKPENTNILEDPGLTLDSVLDMFEAHGVAIVVIVVLGGFIIWRR